jgi:hypothetical protein
VCGRDIRHTHSPRDRGPPTFNERRSPRSSVTNPTSKCPARCRGWTKAHGRETLDARAHPASTREPKEIPVRSRAHADPRSRPDQPPCRLANSRRPDVSQVDRYAAVVAARRRGHSGIRGSDSLASCGEGPVPLRRDCDGVSR